MSFEAGSRLGHYEILSSVGAGGMGEVYRAKDLQLGREVAIKLLLEEVSADPERLARFEREARVLASLNHNNIATLHGFETDEDTSFLVMELVDGETLAERIARGPIPVDEAIPLFIQIAEGLEAAHEKGVIHRDLKPANIKVLVNGKVKILDFGLAKAMTDDTGDSGDGSLSMSPTRTMAATQRGEILGTAAYMSPEQARGREVDQRTDVWAFGACLFEALSGRRAFQGGDATDVMASVLAREPNWEALEPALPALLRRLVKRCLDKDRRRRVPDIGYVLFELQELGDPSDIDRRSGNALSEPVRSTSAMAIGAAALSGALVAAIALWGLRSEPAPQPPLHTILTGTDSRPMRFEGFLSSFALSPDGLTVAYRTDEGMHLRSVGDLESHKIAEFDTHTPFFSPDSQWLGYSTRAGAIMKVSVRGGPAVTLCKTCGQLSATWGDDGFIYFNSGNNRVDLSRISAEGGEPESIKIKASDEIADLRWTELLPGGKAALVTVHRGGIGAGDTRVAVLDLESGELEELVANGGHAIYASSGHLVYGVDGALMAAPFDLDRRQLTGGAIPIFDGLVTSRLSGAAEFGIAKNGSMAFAKGALNPLPLSTLLWLGPDGQSSPLFTDAGLWGTPSISPDGSQVAMSNGHNESDVWIWDIERETATRFTFEPGIDNSPIWAPDGKTIYWAGNREGGWDIFSRTADGTGGVKRELVAERNLFPRSVTPDGAHLLYEERGNFGSADIGLLDLDTGEAEILLGSEFDEFGAMVSPDGRWVAYHSDESGKPDVFVRPFPNVDDGKWQVSAGGGSWALWSRDGTHLYYVAPQPPRIMRVPVEPGKGFRVGPAEVFLEIEPQMAGFGRGWDLHPDGRALIVQSRPGDVASPEIVLVQNFLAELKRLVPTD